ncbi:MAG: hypothetical protein HYW90_04245 [Candidatus Sungbacteria bacterium]|nr:hypothetical protein [Candidatus Sungbacteria bacterium]
MNQLSSFVYEHKRQAAYFKKLAERGFPASAFLFYGPAGIGKKRFAVRLAAGFFCEGKSLFGCGECAPCLKVQSAGHPDVHILPYEDLPRKEIGIDDIRALRQRLWLSPFAGSFRVALVDGAENLTAEAQSAFLKVLEEPPSRTLFFLITSEPHALFETVRSRLLPVSFSIPDGENPGGQGSDRELGDFLKKDIWEQFKAIDRIAEKGDFAAEEFLKKLIIGAREEFFDPQRYGADTERMQYLLDLYANLRRTGVNRRLVLDLAMLNFMVTR